jgi:raffinose/stachyose/melibiose transport system permease protein
MSRPPAARGGVSHRVGRILAGDGFAATLMLLPAGALFATFMAWPFLHGVWLSLQFWDGFSPPRWAGLANYRRLTGDDVFLGAFGHTVIFVAAVVALKIVLGFAAALLLDRRLRGRAFFRAASFVPVTMSFVAVGLLWAWIYNPVFGLLNAGLDLVGLGGLTRAWLGDRHTALAAIVVVDVWKWLGLHAAIFLAGLQTVPAELYESATLDGAGRLDRFWHVTLPLMMPVVFINVILALAGAFVRNFDIVWVLTKGGPDHATEVVLTDMLREAFQNGDMGYAAAMGYVLFVVVGGLSVLLLGVLRWRRLAV